jgi:hypothetical protein
MGVEQSLPCLEEDIKVLKNKNHLFNRMYINRILNMNFRMIHTGFPYNLLRMKNYP